MPGLKSITVHGFRTVERIEKLPLRRLNILIGANGAGKTNLLDAFTLAAAAGKPAGEAVVEDETGASMRTGRQWSEQPQWSGERTEWKPFRLGETGGKPAGSTGDETCTVLNPTGANLPAYLNRMRRDDPAALTMISTTVSLYIAGFGELAGTNVLTEMDWRRRGEEKVRPLTELRGGAWRFLLLATALLRPAAWMPAAILLDEPETGLNPAALTVAAAMMQSAPETATIVAATQSARLLDEFEPDDVIVVEHRTPGGTTAHRLESEPLKTWLEDNSLGELRERNCIGGRPGGG